MHSATLQDIVASRFGQCGFDAAAIVPATPQVVDRERFEQWIEAGMDGGADAGMGYLGRSIEYRGDPTRLMLTVKSVVVTLTNYRRKQCQCAQVPRIAAFAWGNDYHGVIKSRLGALLAAIREHRPSISGRAVVDSAPTFERAWAALAGLGWIGRSSMLVNPELGSYTLIGLLLLDEAIEESDVQRIEPVAAHCGECRRCIEACPTGAIVADGVVDARRCIAFHTIEAAADPTPSLREALIKGGESPRIFGCDACLEACPYNATAAVGSNMPIRAEVINTTAQEWMDMNSEQFAARFANTALLRAPMERIRNIIAMCQP